jgi:WD40 repeat protein
LKKSNKLDQDPILELQHIIGYSPDSCKSVRWAKMADHNVVIFASGGTLIAMDAERRTQNRFFFGHSKPICCFDINSNGTLMASGQEGKNPLVRIWEYDTGRCLSMFTLNVNHIQCLTFSADGKYLATVGRSGQNRESITIWDITTLAQGQPPAFVAAQSSDFNIIELKFSPVDSSRLVSCGKENIRFWRVRRDNKTIRGSAVVLNHHARNSVFTCLDYDYGLKSADPKENESLKRVFVGSKHGMVF